VRRKPTGYPRGELLSGGGEYGYDLVGNRTTRTVTTPGHASRITHYTCDAAHRRTSRKDWPAKPAPIPTRYSPSRSLVIRESLH